MCLQQALLETSWESENWRLKRLSFPAAAGVEAWVLARRPGSWRGGWSWCRQAGEGKPIARTFVQRASSVRINTLAYVLTVTGRVCKNGRHGYVKVGSGASGILRRGEGDLPVDRFEPHDCVACKQSPWKEPRQPLGWDQHKLGAGHRRLWVWACGWR